MELLYAVFVIFLGVGAQQLVPVEDPRCPPPGIGICLVPENPCTTTSQCSNGQICCSIGCGRECRDPNNPGTCPVTLPPPDGIPICPAFIPNLCTSDANCKPDEKCCDDPCGKQCKTPADGGPSQHPGVCPFYKPIYPPPPCAYNPLLECHSDSECDEDERCCQDVCFPKCLKSLPDIVRPGLCPFINPLIQPRCAQLEPECSSDAHCDEGKKCCRDYCGVRCTDIVREEIRLGHCSLPPPPIPLGRPCYNKDLCRGDQDCYNKDQKCCKGSCGTKECLNFVPLVQGECPKTTFSTIPQWVCNFIRHIIPSIRDECEADADCSSQGYKCCKDLCRTTCKKPVPTVPKPPPIPVQGTCPPKDNVLCFAPVNECKTDGDCSGGRKCCETNCGQECKDPIPLEECPDSNPDIRCVHYNEECKSDNDCGRPSTCCRNNCGTKCYSPFPQKG